MKRLEIGQYIALGSTLCTVAGFVLGALTNGSIFSTLVGIGVIGAFVSYFFGGFGAALKIAGKMAKIGWFIVPFPADIFTGIMTFFYAIIILFFVPIIPMRKAYKERMNY